MICLLNDTLYNRFVTNTNAKLYINSLYSNIERKRKYEYFDSENKASYFTKVYKK